jgi:hypothetical protein
VRPAAATRATTIGPQSRPTLGRCTCPAIPATDILKGCSVECDRGGNSMVHARRRPRSPRGATVNTAGVGISNRVEGASGAAAPEGCPQSTSAEAGSLECSEGPQDAGLRGCFFVGRFFVVDQGGRESFSVGRPTSPSKFNVWRTEKDSRPLLRSRYAALADFAFAPLASGTLRRPIPPPHTGPAQLAARRLTGNEKSC